MIVEIKSLKTKRLTVFASGSGTNFQALHRASLKKDFPGVVTALICNRQKAGAVDYARDHDIPVYLLAPEDYSVEADYTRRLEEILQNEKPDLILLAGYLKKIPASIVGSYRNRIINIHPSLLPKYGGQGWYGMRVHRAVIEQGDTVSGSTIHYVTEEYDRGPVIARSRVTVRPDDTPESLAEKIKVKEHILFPETVKKLLQKQ